MGGFNFNYQQTTKKEPIPLHMTERKVVVNEMGRFLQKGRIAKT